MFTFRYKPLISVAMIASLIIVQFSHVPHVHSGSSAEQKFEHGSRAHLHLGKISNGKHGHSHAHGHSHSHSHQDASTGKAKSKSFPAAFNIDHDNDAIYLSLSPASLSNRIANQVDQIQEIVCHLNGYPVGGHPKQTCDAISLWHPPDKFRHCPIYLLKMSIRC